MAGRALGATSWDLGGAAQALGRPVGQFIRMNRKMRCSPYFQVRGEILRPWADDQGRKLSASVSPLIKDESMGIEDDQIPS